MKRKSLGYGLIIFLLSTFALIIYGAYSPARKSQKQRIVCFKFKEGTKTEAIERHMHDFAALRHEIPQIVSYTSGKTLPGDNGQNSEFDVVHYLTFQNESDIETYNQSQKYQEFVKNNQAHWDKVFAVNSDIR